MNLRIFFCKNLLVIIPDVQSVSQQLNNVFGILPEEAFKLTNGNSRRARLWRKVYYLEYLRELYKRLVTYLKCRNSEK